MGPFVVVVVVVVAVVLFVVVVAKGLLCDCGRPRKQRLFSPKGELFRQARGRSEDPGKSDNPELGEIAATHQLLEHLNFELGNTATRALRVQDLEMSEPEVGI